MTHLTIGLLVSLALSRIIASRLWDVSPYDSATLASLVQVLLVTGLVACHGGVRSKAAHPAPRIASDARR